MDWVIAISMVGQRGYDRVWMLPSNLHQACHTGTAWQKDSYMGRIMYSVYNLIRSISFTLVVPVTTNHVHCMFRPTPMVGLTTPFTFPAAFIYVASAVFPEPHRCRGQSSEANHRQEGLGWALQGVFYPTVDGVM